MTTQLLNVRDRGESDVLPPSGRRGLAPGGAATSDRGTPAPDRDERDDSPGVETEAGMRRAVAESRRRDGETHPSHASCLMTLALALEARGDLDGAVPLLHQALAIRHEAPGPDHPEYAATLACIARASKRRGDLRWAGMLYREALAICRPALGDRHPGTVRILTGLAEVHWFEKDRERAEPLMREALEAQRADMGPRHPSCATSLSILAGISRKRGDLAAAERALDLARSIRREAFGEDHLQYANTLSSLAFIHLCRDDPMGAEPLLRQALVIRTNALGERDPVTLDTLGQLRSLVMNSGEVDITGYLRQDPPDRSRTPPAVVVTPLVETRTGAPTADAPNATTGQPGPAFTGPTTVAPSRGDPTTPITPEEGPEHGPSRIPTIETDPERNEPMAPSNTEELSRSLAILEDALSDHAERLLHAARQLQSVGELPDGSLAEGLSTLRGEYTALRDRLAARAEDLALACPAPGGTDRIEDLAEILRGIVAEEAREAELEERRRGALDTLDQIARLIYTGPEDQSPLIDLLADVEALRARIANSSGPEPEGADVAEDLAGGRHPLCHLLTLVEHGEHLDDEPWAIHHEQVVSNFGKPLAAAAARGRIRIALESEVAPHGTLIEGAVA